MTSVAIIPEGLIVPPMTTTSMIEMEESMNSAEFHSQLQLLKSTPPELELMDYDFPSVLITYFKEIVSELSTLESPKKIGRLQFWIAPFLKRKAGLSSLTPAELASFHENFSEIPEVIKRPILDKYKCIQSAASVASAIASAVKRSLSLDCKARVVHLIADPSMIGQLSDSYSVLDRPGLDDKFHRDDVKIKVFNEYKDFESMDD